MFMVEENQHVDKELMEKISSLEFSFILVYRKRKEYVLSKI